MPPGQQAGSPQACPEPVCGLGFDISKSHSRRVFGWFTFVRLPQFILDALWEHLFHNVHHPGHGAGAACGSLESPPARRFRGAYPHRQRSIASGSPIYIGLPSAFVAQQTSSLSRQRASGHMVHQTMAPYLLLRMEVSRNDTSGKTRCSMNYWTGSHAQSEDV